MSITPLKGDPLAGVAGSYSETIDPQAAAFVTGDVPAILGTDEIVATNMVMAVYTVVGFDGSGNLIPAVLGTTPAIGILMTDVDTTAVVGQSTPVWRMGCYNPEICVWDASYATLADQKKAFEGAPSPTAIVMREPQTITV